MPHCYTWYVIDVLPTAIPSCNSLFESSTDKPATATIDSNIENNNDDLHIMYPTTMIIIIMQTLTNSQVPQQISHQPNTCHQSWLDPSTALQYALIGVYDKLLNRPILSCSLYLFTCIVLVALSCFVLLADSFALVKILKSRSWW